VLLTDRLVVGVRSGVTDCGSNLPVLGGIKFPSGFACIVLLFRPTTVRTVHMLVRVVIVVSLFMYFSRISFVSYVICDSGMHLVTALGFEARKPRSIVLVITDLNTLT
jgi:hypothetical protein